MIKSDSIIEKNHEILASDIDGETVMMSIKNGKYYGMDEIGSRIWSLINGENTATNIVNKLLKEFDVSREECMLDVMDFLEELKKNELIRYTNQNEE